MSYQRQSHTSQADRISPSSVTRHRGTDANQDSKSDDIPARAAIGIFLVPPKNYPTHRHRGPDPGFPYPGKRNPLLSDLSPLSSLSLSLPLSLSLSLVLRPSVLRRLSWTLRAWAGLANITKPCASSFFPALNIELCLCAYLPLKSTGPAPDQLQTSSRPAVRTCLFCAWLAPALVCPEVPSRLLSLDLDPLAARKRTRLTPPSNFGHSVFTCPSLAHLVSSNLFDPLLVLATPTIPKFGRFSRLCSLVSSL